MLNLAIIITPLTTFFVWSDKILNGVNLFTTTFNWIFGKIQFFKKLPMQILVLPTWYQSYNFWVIIFCQCELIWARKTVPCNHHFQLSFFSVLLPLPKSFNYSCKWYLPGQLVVFAWSTSLCLIPKTYYHSTKNLAWAFYNL